MIRALSTLIVLLAGLDVLARELFVDPVLFATAEKAMPKEAATNRLFRTLESGLWNPERTIVAVSVTQPKASTIFIFFKQTNGTFLAVDASTVEDRIFDKLGHDRKYYDRFETKPVEWFHRKDGLFRVWIRTEAWRDGKCYVVCEPLIVKPDGTVLFR